MSRVLSGSESADGVQRSFSKGISSAVASPICGLGWFFWPLAASFFAKPLGTHDHFDILVQMLSAAAGAAALEPSNAELRPSPLAPPEPMDAFAARAIVSIWSRILPSGNA